MSDSSCRNPVGVRVAIAVAALAVASVNPRAALGAEETPAPIAGRSYDLTRDHVLYCIGYAHLDTQWRWTYPTTINRFIKDTLHQNFQRFEKYPGYVFNFTGSARYQMMKEYYPAEYERLKDYIREGRWFVAGSSVDEGDVNVPSPESIIRQVLYANSFFRREFGVESIEYMLPDCFGFPASLPSILAHCGLKGFSTQKLTWGSAVGIPFNVGVWVGPDGRSVIAALNPGDYVGSIKGRVDVDADWAARIEENGRRYGLWTDFHYYGVGDEGGAPREEDVANYSTSAARTDGRMTVALAGAGRMFADIAPPQRSRLPRYRGDLLLTEHSAGTITSQAYMKRWNRKNEQLADAAERAAVTAAWLGGGVYPAAQLERSWVRFLGSQMHDMLPGTALPTSISHAWNDEVIALNGFADVLTGAIGAASRVLDTRARGTAIVVYNPLAIDREDTVEVALDFPAGAPQAVRIYDAEAQETPSQILERVDHSMRVLFIAHVPSVGLSVYDARPADSAYRDASAAALRVDGSGNGRIENEFHRLTLDPQGNPVSLQDKSQGGREQLAGVARLVFTHERPRQWPAWNMDWTDRMRPPLEALAEPADVPMVRVVESGPVRVALQIRRRGRESDITQTIRLARGSAGRRIEFVNEIDWQSTACALRAEFPLTSSNPRATYNWGLGTIERGNNDPKKYEVPSHEWFDLTDRSGRFGVSVLEDCKFGSDKPRDDLLRLTLLYTPGVRRAYMDQHSQDWGRHDVTYALYPHAGDWRVGRSEWQARRLNQPLRAFAAPSHEGALGRSISLARVNTDQVDIRAIKQSEDGKWTIVRLQELLGDSAENVAVSFAAPIEEAQEVDGQERRIAAAMVAEGRLVTTLSPCAARAFAVRLTMPTQRVAPPTGVPIELMFNTDAISIDADRSNGRVDSEGRTYPGELLPSEIVSGGITFKLGSSAKDALNALACHGQEIALPAGGGDRVYLIAAATEEATATFTLGAQAVPLRVQPWTGLVGQFDCRRWERPFEEIDHHCDAHVIGLNPAFIRRDPIAWFSTQRHHPRLGNEAYQFSYLFRYSLPRPAGASVLRLPQEPRILLFAATAAEGVNESALPLAPLYDDFSHRAAPVFRHVYPPPAPPVFANVTPTASVTMDRADRFDRLRIGPPRGDDDADASRSPGRKFRFYPGDEDLWPHSASGRVKDELPRLNDGQVAQNDDDMQRCIWYDCEGRFFVDLGSSNRIQRINTYSRHTSNRAPQYFSLWGANGETMPAPTLASSPTGDWTLLAIVDSRRLGNGGCHGSSVTGKGGPLEPYRYLLWIAEDVGEGTFFTEIDVDLAR